MKHYYEENVYDINYKIFKTLSPVMTSLTQTFMYQSDRKININNYTIFEESNSFLMSAFEHYKILMPPHPLLPRCDVINHKFVQERS